jgi:hypothetical protein
MALSRISRSRAADLGSFVASLGRRILEGESVRFVVHCVLILALVVLVRSVFSSRLPAVTYEATSILQWLVDRDLETIEAGAQHQMPAVPKLLFLVIPTGLLLLSGARITWDQWTAGRSLRVLILILLGMMVWAGATFDYNLYLLHLHLSDRLLLVALAILSWKTPLAVPFATLWSIVMIREPYIPIPLDDFDWRPVGEMLIVFSCFTWLSFRRSFDTKHFLWAALGVWASYYYIGGTAKIFYGSTFSWLLEDHLTNLAIGSHVRGWLGFVPSEIFVGAMTRIRPYDIVFAVYTIVFEVGALFCFHIHPRVARIWLLGCALLHVGIFAMTGVFFWKWLGANLALYWFVRRGRGERVLRDMCRSKAGILLAVAALYYSENKIWFYPQSGVAWYDSRFMENYVLVAVGSKTGARYVVDPVSITPMEMHWTQGRLCYATAEPSLTGIYGITGSLDVYRAMETLQAPAQALDLFRTAGRCADPSQEKVFDDFMKRYFGNMNKYGRPHRWISWIGRPKHLWLQVRGKLYKQEEPIARIELWRELVVEHGGKLHRLDIRKLRQVPIPQP